MSSNKDVGNAFISGNKATSGNMFTDGKTLYSYNTAIATKRNGKIYVNKTKYSRTTSKQLTQSGINNNPDYVYVDNKPRGYDFEDLDNTPDKFNTDKTWSKALKK